MTGTCKNCKRTRFLHSTGMCLPCWMMLRPTPGSNWILKTDPDGNLRDERGVVLDTTRAGLIC